MDTKAIAGDLAEMFKAVHGHEVGVKSWSDDVVSVEPGAPPGRDPAARGRLAIEAKGRWWTDNHEVQNASAEGPFVNGDQAAFGFEIDVKVKATDPLMHMTEIGLYTLKDGNIAEERFLY